MKTLIKPVRLFSARYLLTLLALLLTVSRASELQLDCLQRDWFTVFAKDGADVADFHIATTEPQSGLTRLAIALKETKNAD